MEPEDKLQDLVRRFARAEKRNPRSTPQPRPAFPGKRISLKQPLIIRASHIWMLSISILLIGGALIIDEIKDRRTQERLESQQRYMHYLEQRLSEYETTTARQIRELPPPYTEVRSGFPDWHICTTDDCDTPRNEPF